MWHLVGRRGLVVTDSVVTRRLGHVKGITMNLEMVRFPGEKLLHREELECRGHCVQGLKQCSLLYFFVILSPCAIRAVETSVSWRDGWSNHDTLSVTSGSPRSSKDALDARFVLAGLTLNDPFDVVTACLKIWYRAAEIFLLSPSSSSSSEKTLLISGSRDWRTWSGISGFAATPSSSDGRPDTSVRCPGRSLWSPKKSLGSSGSSLWSYSRRGWSPGCWVMSGIRC